MPEKDLLIREKVEHNGLFDFAGFYGYVHSWLKSENYDVIEEKYVEKVSEKGRDVLCEWKASKKTSDYFKIEHALKFETQGMVEVEAEIDGKKKKMNKGKVSCEIKGNLIKDYDSKWEATPTYKFLRDAYNKYIVPARVDSMQTKVISDVIALKEEMKAYLDLIGKR